MTHDERNWRGVKIYAVVFVIITLLGLIFTPSANAHDPDAPEYYVGNGGGSVHYNKPFDPATSKAGDYFVVGGVVLITALLWALPKIFDGEYVNNMYSSCIDFTFSSLESTDSWVPALQKGGLLSSSSTWRRSNGVASNWSDPSNFGDLCIRLPLYSFSF